MINDGEKSYLAIPVKDPGKSSLWEEHPLWRIKTKDFFVTASTSLYDDENTYNHPYEGKVSMKTLF